MSTQINYGIATPRVRFYSKLPRVVRKPQSFNFDVSAYQWNAINNSPFLSPLLTEHVVNPEKTFAVCFPSKRKYYVNNMLIYKKPGDPSITPFSFPISDKSGAPPNKTIFWTPVGPPPKPPAGGGTASSSTVGIINNYLKEQEFPSYYPENFEDPEVNPEARKPLLDASSPPAPGTLEEYDGPIWFDKNYKTQAQPDDRQIINRFRNFVTGGTATTGSSLLRPLRPKPPKEELERTAVYQSEVRDGLWWGLESSYFLQDNMPFWLTIEFPEDPPPPSSFETFFIVSLGVSSNENKDRYDLVLSPGKKPTLIDYYGVGSGGVVDADMVREFETESSRIDFTERRLDIGVMAAGGRLIFFVNDIPLVYTRILKAGAAENRGNMKEAKIRRGRIRVYGTNTSAKIYAYPMVFAEQACLSFPIASEKVVDSDEGPVVTRIKYSAADKNNDPTGKPVALLPKAADVSPPPEKNYGVDAEVFEDSNGSLTITNSFGMQKNGVAEFYSSKLLITGSTGFTGSTSFGSFGTTSPLASSDFYMLFLTPENRTWVTIGGTSTLPAAKTPYFFRLKGVDKEERNPGPPFEIEATPDLMSLKENSSAPDYHHIKKSATITLYNEGGRYDFLKFQQYGARIFWGWDDKNDGVFRKLTFTGIITSADDNMIPGKETITLQCEDYNYILKNTPIINSPFYDGMVAHHAVKDLAKRGGIKDIDSDWDGGESLYFLPSGYSFTSPKVRFKGTDKLFDCMINLLKRFEAYIYFDGSGRLKVAKLPGGLLGEPPPFIPVTDQFSSNPLSGLQTILDQKNVTISFNNTVNHINVMTLERDTRNPIFLSKTAGRSDVLTFKKEWLVDQPAYGEIEVARYHRDLLAQRMFFPTRKTSWKTVGGDVIHEPLTFVIVDGVLFRLISVSRNFNAETNDFTNEYEAEWLNGR
jgi:hypothetical protein